MEAEARDSEEETEPDVEGLSNLHGGSGTLIPSSELRTPVREVPKIQQDKTTEKGSPYINEDILMKNNSLLCTPTKETTPDKASDLGDFDDKGLEEFRHVSAGSHAREDNGSAASSRISKNMSFPGCRTVELNKEENTSSSGLRTTKKSPYSEATVQMSSSLSYSGKISRQPEPLLAELSNHQVKSPQILGEKAAVDVYNSSPLTSKQAESGLKTAEIQIQTVTAEKHHDEEPSEFLAQKRKATALNTALSSPSKGDMSATTIAGSSEVDLTTVIDAPPSNADPSFNNNDPVDKVNMVNKFTNQPVEPSKTKSASIMKKSVKRMRPVSRIKESKNNCFPLDGMARSLSCHVEPSHTLDKQTAKSDATNDAGKSAAETDMNCLDFKAKAISGRSAAEGFMKEQMPESSVGIKANNGDVKLSRPPDSPVSESGVPQKLPEHEEISSPNRKVVDFEKSKSAAHSSLLTGRDNFSGKLSKKFVAKRSISSRPKLSSTNKSIPQDEPVESKDGTELAKAMSDNSTEMPIEVATRASDSTMEDGTHSVNKTKVESKAINEKILMDVEKEKESNMAKSNSVVSDLVMEEGTCRSVNKTKSKRSRMNKKEALMEVEIEKKPVMDKSNSITSDGSMKEKVNSVTKLCESLAIDEKDTAMDLEKVRNLNEAESTSEASVVVMEKLNGVRCHMNKTMSIASTVDNTEKLIDAEKENRPTENGGRSLNSNKHGNHNDPVQSIEKSTGNEVGGGTDVSGLHAFGGSRVVNIEPVWFILSGHRLQRKEFQQVIRRLRGRLCRDSHQWSYQATHFIVPDPVRRTEKFFAAAAAGR